MSNRLAYLGIGLYSVPEVARLTGVSAPRIRRWLGGYRYLRDGAEHRSEPLWRPQIPPFDHDINLGFRDLAEVRVIGALVAQGIGLVTIRRALQQARDLIGDERPFSSARFRTDGRRIFVEITGDAEEPLLLDVARRQHLFHSVVKPSFRDLDMDDEGAVRWWPLGHGRHVVLDPARAFGQPIVDAGGVPTVVLADAVAAEGSLPLVARLYDVPEAAVRAAVRFQEGQADEP
ncbi:hypothetical protein [Caenispirillum bisanense]|uniref:hypothetical protein n=1 Tax=Caenispirillum bisanense TaxID=414052 RepID=UPI0031D1A560